MSDDRTDDIPRHDSSRPQHENNPLSAIVDDLNSRVVTFEENLESAVLAETQFRTNVETLLNSLNAFVERHVEKDRHLTQLIEEDTQRSKEAKEEYDALASRFDDNLRRDNITRTTKWLSTISVYIGIVVSVVLMAPFHALWWLFTRALTKTGFLKSSDETTVFSTARRRRRDVPHKTTSSNRPVTAPRHRRHASAKSGATVDGGRSPAFSNSTAKNGRETGGQSSLRDAPNSESGNNLRDQKHRDVSRPVENANVGADSGDALLRDTITAGWHTRLGEEAHETESSDSAEEYFDARDDSKVRSPDFSETEAAQDEQSEQKDDGSETNRENIRPRPGWAVPGGSDETPPDMNTFPSSDFWEISDDDIRLEVQQPDEASS